ncbi:flavin reductase family protein [Pseudomonadota bacterium]
MTSLVTNPGIDERSFRQAMGSFATGVCVITTQRADGEAVGMTVNSFSSVSLAPPLVLFCLGQDSPRGHAMIEAGRFNVNILAADQVAASNHFAKPGEGIAPEGGHSPADNGCPSLHGAVSVIECDLETTHPGGDHTIIVGRVTRLTTDMERQPLLYARGYRQLGDAVE